MRFSNRKVVLYLLDKGYDDIWLRPHTRRHDLVYAKDRWYRAMDLWNLFDGICIDPWQNIVFIQIKTNSWAKEQPLIDWVNKTNNSRVLSFNVHLSKKDNKWIVSDRLYKHA